MMRRSAAFGSLVGVAVLVVGVVTASPAGAEPPVRSTFTTHFTNPDAFGGPDAPGCPFTVVGDWDVTLNETDFFNETTGNISYAIVRVDFVGTFSNPLSGKSIPDSDHQDQLHFYYDDDGNLVKVVENESRDDPLFSLHFHSVNAPDGTFLKSVGRDVLFINKHPVSVEPVCEALA